MSRIIFVILCALIIWVPIPFGSNRPWAWSLLQLLIAITFALHLFNAWRGTKPLLPQNKKAYWLLAPLAITQLWVFIQTLPIAPNSISGAISLDPAQSQISLLRGISYTMWAWLLLIYVNKKSRIKRLMQIIVLSGLIQAGYASLEILLDGSLGWLFVAPLTDRANGSFIYHNHLANYMGLCIAAALGLLMYEMKTEREDTNWRQKLRGFYEFVLSSKIIIRLSAIVMIIALILTKSRMGNAGFFAALTMVGLYALFFYRNKPVHFKTLIISIFILDIAIVGAVFGIDKVRERLETTSFASEARDEVVIDSMPMLEQYWLTGTGAGSFYSTFPNYQPAVYFGFYDHAHNDYLQFVAELGAPVVLMLLVMLIAIAWQQLTAMTKRGRLERGAAFAGLMAIIYMAFHSTVDFSMQAPAGMLIFMCFISLVLARSQQCIE
ncbi:O-antigen ligase family protein [Salinibius halmophilus]|uniref:O-antigen ligase family protein n=1 Tax=Salinibius halmophilus TaxID=1853216 RepID=UPI000E66C63D|nr:O-antigen ligase family protein [Salinibius halmophilus]